jgi:hypothetical protein
MCHTTRNHILDVSANKSNHPTHNPFLLVTKPLTRDNIMLRRYERRHSPVTVKNHYKVTWPWARFSCLLYCVEIPLQKETLAVHKRHSFGVVLTYPIYSASWDFHLLRWTLFSREVSCRKQMGISAGSDVFAEAIFQIVFFLCFLPACFLTYSSILKMMAIRYSETLTNISDNTASHSRKRYYW